MAEQCDSSQPTVGETGAVESGNDVGTPAHQLPEQFRTIVLDHQDDWTLIDSEVKRRHPTMRSTGPGRVGRVEAGPETVGMVDAQVDVLKAPQHRQHDFLAKR